MASTYERVAVGTDGSAASLRAVDTAAALAADANARLLIICAYHQDDRADTTTDSSRIGAVRASDTEQAEHALDDASVHHVIGSTPAEELLVRARQRVTAPTADKVETVAVLGAPGQAVVEAADERSADVVVVGNRGLNSLRGRVLGSVPQEIARRATADVLIVDTT